MQRWLARAWRLLAWLARLVLKGSGGTQQSTSSTPVVSNEDAKIATPLEEVFDCLIPMAQQYQLVAKEFADARMEGYKLSLDVASRRTTERDEFLRDEGNRIVKCENEILMNLCRALWDTRGEIDRLQSVIRDLDAAHQARRGGLSRVSGCENETRTGDVVFVHGLNGDAVGTWCHNGDESRFFWPRWLGQSLPGVGVWLLGYDAQAIRFKHVSMELKDRAAGALNTLNNERLGDFPIVFICHSMGGLLVKEMLRRAANNNIPPEWKKVKKRTAGILFLGTPHHGSEVASVLHSIVRLAGLPCDIKELRAHDPYLRELNDWFRENVNLKRMRLMSCFETHCTGPCVVVDKSSTDLQIAGVPPIPINGANHVTICKPQSESADVYKTAKRFVEDALHI